MIEISSAFARLNVIHLCSHWPLKLVAKFMSNTDHIFWNILRLKNNRNGHPFGSRGNNCITVVVSATHKRTEKNINNKWNSYL